ncbi:CUB and sushi domain-containing protein 3-like, partial [Oncorhynchus tshawytscha]|uniref:CUB and sushi domain-containing protein 3-like n=1 Tax=Oncorhynchus tshawytscha TaxID=74940 RepID=UPI001C3C356B
FDLSHCEDPGVPQFGFKVSDQGHFAGSAITYGCDQGYSLHGSGILKCMTRERRAWDNHLPSCIAECGGRFKGESTGRILSPGYPFPYDNNLRCTWTITVNSGNIVSLQFLAFDTEASHDILEVWDGPAENEMSLREVSGSLLPRGYTAPSTSSPFSSRLTSTSPSLASPSTSQVQWRQPAEIQACL